MTTSELSMKKNNSTLITIIIPVLLALAGVGAWVYQLNQGMQTTGLTQQIVWGVYIAAFFTAIGAGAALLALTGAAEYFPLFAGINRARNLRLALTSFIIGVCLITMDVGNPFQIWRIITGFRFSSLMTWDLWFLFAAGIVTLVYLFSVKSDKPQKGLGALGIAAAIAVVAVEGWMLSTMPSRPFWGSAYTVLSFLLGAIIAGISIILAAGDARENTQNWMKIALWLSLALVVIDVLTGVVGGSAEVGLILGGFAAPFFWFQIILGVLLPIGLLTRKKYEWLAGILAIFGVVAEKIWMLAAGEAKPWLALPEETYFPTWVEIIAVIGMVALGVLVYRGLSKIFKSS